jgi:hypothetical protein
MLCALNGLTPSKERIDSLYLLEAFKIMDILCVDRFDPVAQYRRGQK